jgi:hypothetical protein
MDKSYLNSRYNKPSILKLVKLRLGFFMVLCLFFVSNAFGQITYTWNGSTSTAWNNSANWTKSIGTSTPGTVATDIVIIPTTATNQPKLSTALATSIASLTFTSTTAATLTITGQTLNVTGAVTLLNSAATYTNASISGSGTLLCGSLNIGVPTVTSTAANLKNTFTISINTLTVSGNITSNNDDPGRFSSQPVWNINSPCNLSANSVIFTHTGIASAGQTKSNFNLASGATLNLSSATPFVVNYNVKISSAMITTTAASNTINFPSGCYVNLCGTSTAPTSISNSNAAGTASPIVITYGTPPSVGISTPTFSLGLTSTRCQGAGSATYTATSTNSTGITYTLDTASISGGNSIVSTTGVVTYAAGWSGTTIITASAAGCNGPKTATHTVTINPNLPASVSITSDAANGVFFGIPYAVACDADIVTFTATPTNGGASPSYQWQVNGANVGTNSPTYLTSSLAIFNNVQCIITSNASCASPTTATSAQIFMWINT